MNSFWNNLVAVARRELAVWRKRSIYLIGAILPVVASAIFYLTFFGAGMPSKLPIGVVDNDRSSLTRNFIRQLDATQLGSVREFDTFAQARDEMQKGHITSICVLPENMYADVQSGVQPKFTFYINGLYFVGGSLAYKDILTMINLTSGGVQRQVLRAKGVNEHAIGGLLRPIDIDIHQIGNPTTDYGIYLCGGLLPGLLAMTVVLILIYSLGTEIKYNTSKHLMETAGNNIHTAILGKMMVYTPLFCLIGWGLLGLLYGWMHFPFAGNFAWMILAIFLLVLASEAIAVLAVGLLPICRFALSVGALYSVLSFSMSGFSLPVERFLPWLRGFSEMFPLRHYYQFFVEEGIFAGGFAGLYPEIIHLLIFLLIPVFILPRLERAYLRIDEYSKD